MIVERSMHPGWLSNTYLVADRPGGSALLVDSGGPPEPILARIEELGVTPTHLLCTHHHVDHVANSALFRDRFGCAVCGHAAERDLFPAGLDRGLEDGEALECGALRVRALHIPGHTAGQLAFVVDEVAVFTGDTLFRRSVGGTRAPGHTDFQDLRRSVMDVLMGLPPEMTVYPGHADPTTIGDEWEQNPFVRLWRGLDEPGDARCLAAGRPATLLLRGPDYDGGTKCWVRLDEGGQVEGGIDEIVGGSQVRDA